MCTDGTGNVSTTAYVHIELPVCDFPCLVLDWNERDRNWKVGAGDGDRTRDIQLGKLRPTFRSTTNQAHTAGLLGPSVALSARIEHDSDRLERETGIEPVTSSLGSCGQPFGPRQIKHIQRAF